MFNKAWKFVTCNGRIFQKTAYHLLRTPYTLKKKFQNNFLSHFSEFKEKYKSGTSTNNSISKENLQITVIKWSFIEISLIFREINDNSDVFLAENYLGYQSA